jgi:hypothetical protein
MWPCIGRRFSSGCNEKNERSQNSTSFDRDVATDSG